MRLSAVKETVREVMGIVYFFAAIGTIAAILIASVPLRDLLGF